MIRAMQDYLGEVSWLGAPAPVLAVLLILGVDLLLTLVHVVQEFKGRFWNYFGGIAGVRVPDWLGFALFSIGLTLLLWSLAFAALAGGLSPFIDVPDRWSMACLGAIIGGRIADGFFSHIRLDRAGYRPNPGLESVPYCFAEAAALAVLFAPGLRMHALWALAGVAAGVLFFWSVLPGFRLIRRITMRSVPGHARDPWIPGEPRPDWASQRADTSAGP